MKIGRKKLQVLVLHILHRHRANALLVLEVVQRLAVVVVLDLHLSEQHHVDSPEFLLRAHVGQLNAHTLLHALLPSIGEVPQHLDDVVIIIRDELLAQRANRAGIYPS